MRIVPLWKVSIPSFGLVALRKGIRNECGPSKQLEVAVFAL